VKLSRLFIALLVLSFVRTADAAPPKTFFDHVEDSWAFGEIGVMEPMKFREGRLLAYPGKITELVYARYGRPRSILLIHEIIDPEQPLPFEPGERFVAPLRVLPRTAYWRDNLPNTPRHQVLGGRRYIFKGDAAETAKKVGGAYAATIGRGMPDRKLDQVEIVADALTSPLAVLREDAVRYLSDRRLTHVREASAAKMSAFAASDAPVDQRIAIIGAIARAGLTSEGARLEKLGAGDDAVAAAALRAATTLGRPRTLEQLQSLTKAHDALVRAWAFEELGRRASTEPAALESAVAVLSSDEDAEVRAAAARGLGESRDAGAVDALAAAVERGDAVSRTAASALAAIGGDRAVTALKKAVVAGPSEGMIGAVMAMVELRSACKDCLEFLREQHRSHPEAAIRDLIAIVLELNVKHEN
jgi:hypothetical protein